MRHVAAPAFWACHAKLPEAIQRLAKKNFELLKEDLRHPSLHFKRVGPYRSVRVGLSYRALGVEEDGFVIWFWIGTHGEYDRLIS